MVQFSVRRFEPQSPDHIKYSKKQQQLLRVLVPKHCLFFAYFSAAFTLSGELSVDDLCFEEKKEISQHSF
jgi:hypothetical protein